MMTNLERLVYMANQIARNFEAQGREVAISATADHIAKYWDPRMKASIAVHLDAGGAGIGETARAALLSLGRASVSIE